MPESEICNECRGRRMYWTEWSDRAEAEPELKRLVLEYPDPPDGTVLIRCHRCNSCSQRVERALKTLSAMSGNEFAERWLWLIRREILQPNGDPDAKVEELFESARRMWRTIEPIIGKINQAIDEWNGAKK